MGNIRYYITAETYYKLKITYFWQNIKKWQNLKLIFLQNGATNKENEPSDHRINIVLSKIANITRLRRKRSHLVSRILPFICPNIVLK